MRLRESKLRDELTNEVTRTRESYADALEALSSTRHALTAAEESYRVRRLLFQYGRATSTELTDTETQLTQARARAVDALVRVRAARVEVLYTLGRPIG
jgi:outer membrane protein TolC